LTLSFSFSNKEKEYFTKISTAVSKLSVVLNLTLSPSSDLSSFSQI